MEGKELKKLVKSIIKDGGGVIANSSVWAIEINKGSANITRMPASNQHRALEYLGLVNQFSKWLPNMLILYSNEDGPSVPATGEKKEKYIQAARQGRSERRASRGNGFSANNSFPRRAHASRPSRRTPNSLVPVGLGRRVSAGLGIEAKSLGPARWFCATSTEFHL